MHLFLVAVFFAIVWKSTASQAFKQTSFKVKYAIKYRSRFIFNSALRLRMGSNPIWRPVYGFLIVIIIICLRVSKKKFDPLAEFSRLAGKLKDKVMNPSKGKNRFYTIKLMTFNVFLFLYSAVFLHVSAPTKVSTTFTKQYVSTNFPENVSLDVPHMEA